MTAERAALVLAALGAGVLVAGVYLVAGDGAALLAAGALLLLAGYDLGRKA